MNKICQRLDAVDTDLSPLSPWEQTDAGLLSLGTPFPAPLFRLVTRTSLLSRARNPRVGRRAKNSARVVS